MIYTEIGGRCGNQMFLYAVSRRLEEMYGKGICFNFYQIYEHQKKDKTWKDDLKEFKVEEYKVESFQKPLVYIHGTVCQKIVWTLCRVLYKLPCKSRASLYKRQEKIQPFVNRFGIYFMVHGYSPLIESKAKNQFVCGRYEDSRFFNEIREKLVKELEPKTEINKSNKELYDLICDSESVCVSFRRGDDFVKGKEKALRDICSLKYYYEAIEEVKKRIPNAKFFFFSDDITWVKENFNCPVESHFESGTDPIAEKMRLMSACKHFIMSNSTFCWWAQYLSINEKKIVVSPDHWFNMSGYQHQLIEKDWVLIEC